MIDKMVTGLFIRRGMGGTVSTYRNELTVIQYHPAISGNEVVWQDYRVGIDFRCILEGYKLNWSVNYLIQKKYFHLLLLNFSYI